MIEGTPYWQRAALVWDSDLGPRRRLMMLALNEVADQWGCVGFADDVDMSALTGFEQTKVDALLTTLAAEGLLQLRTSGYHISFEELKARDRQLRQAAEPGGVNIAPLENPEVTP